ncbi:hypothetical protein [Asticcacaulis sp. EMRT-3]|uniref:hypothetical protein n=1 Tax=Asticcacaulis sp. EMRT-3 TaxID=3040349 RepID=UPI0024AE9457|nr:hypothetical protein [Asticcacaulis sp. EMRT-3]MDI7773982.1 hypothetical protein [Asticcacaulis sp. EMRT-3]
MFNFSSQIDAMKTFIIGITLILASTILGFIWISIGLFALVVHTIGPIWGPIALGGLFLLPILIYFGLRLLPQNRRKRKQSAIDEAFNNSTVGSISRLIDTLSATSPVLATVAAIAAGFVATRFPQFLPMFSQIVLAFGEELQLHKVRRTEKKARQAKADYERTVNNPSPPDVEPVNKRRRKTPDMY